MREFLKVLSLLLLALYAFGLGWYISSEVNNKIKSKDPIQPHLELFMENNKVDTLYVYIKPNEK